MHWNRTTICTGDRQTPNQFIHKITDERHNAAPMYKPSPFLHYTGPANTHDQSESNSNRNTNSLSVLTILLFPPETVHLTLLWLQHLCGGVFTNEVSSNDQKKPTSSSYVPYVLKDENICSKSQRSQQSLKVLCGLPGKDPNAQQPHGLKEVLHITKRYKHNETFHGHTCD